MITADEVMPLLLAACPSFEQRWAEVAQDPTHLNDDGSRLHYIDAAAFARHLLTVYKQGDIGTLSAVFDVIERLHLEGDGYVKELATIGYLEDLQNVAGWDDEVNPDDFIPYLGPETRRWWRGLDLFWAGEASLLEPTDD